MTVTAESQSLTPDAIVELFEIDATQVGQGMLYFAGEAINGQPLTFNGQPYTPLPITASGFQYTGQGKLPRPTLQITAMSLSFLSLVVSADDLIGLPIRRKRTYRKHLDDGSDPDPQALFPIDYYVFDRKAKQTATEIQFDLAVQMDQRGRQIPNRQVLRDACTQRYRAYTGTAFDYSRATCPYAGTSYFDATGASVTDPAKDQCGKKLSDCKLRFGANGHLPFWGFPGVGQTNS